ncbi:MFS general substrate transporter [Hyaloscypha hepaticicola]|uniref:MFS general substrate transporter n=1 Tax=Hyaloscypha hepaticicola TaxID=2082293 RepID=A0A2J6QN07_9HELO|nr:MFS general substrate transporter [Hyaloscypha hepaticicola]
MVEAKPVPAENEQRNEEFGVPAVDVEHDRDTFLPRPSDSPNDPLNWSIYLKGAILIQVCLLAAIGTLNTAIINPAYGPLAKEFHITTVRASYQTTVVIALNGVGPFLWIPLANVYGRRPVYLFTTLLGFGSALGSAYAKNFNQLIVARVFNGLWPAAMALGPATVVDLFFYHQRGRAMGIFTVILTSGAHIAPIVGGLIGQYLGWRWTFKFAAILDGVMLVIITFCLPETLYIRDQARLTRTMSEREIDFTPKTYASQLRLYSTFPQLKLRWNQFIIPSLKMARYPSVLFPALYYAASYGFASILPAVTVASIFSAAFHWNTLEIGLAYGGALSIGGILGEFAAGLVLDAIIKRARHQFAGANPPPEIRLKAIWTGAILVPAGLLIYGFTLAYHVFWFAPLFGMGLACFGLQVIATTCYTYSIDSYRAESSETAQLFNLIRQEFGMTYAFYVVKLCQKIGYQWAFFLFTIFNVLAFIPMVMLMFKGREWREKLGVPRNVNALDAEYEGPVETDKLGGEGKLEEN